VKNSLLADNVQSDERAFHIAYSLHIPVYQSMTYVHPYLYGIHSLRDNECVVSEFGRILLPLPIKLRIEELSQQGLYVLDTGRQLYIIIGKKNSIQNNLNKLLYNLKKKMEE